MNYIKFIRIFLLVLIFIGIGLLATQKMWVPKVVEIILKNENDGQPIPVIYNGKSELKNSKTGINSSIIPSFKIDGVCSQNDVSDQSTDYVQKYSEFKVTGDSTTIKSKIKPCETKSLDFWAMFALTEAENRTTISPSELEWWTNSIVKINSLEPIQCGVIENPGSENKIAILKFNMNAGTKKMVTGNGLLSFIQLDKSNNPVKTLAQFISNESIYDITRDVGVKYICDLDKDSKVEIILKDQRYAGYSFWTMKLAEDFSNVNLNSVEGLRGD
ncbi:hypothetical protein EXS45_02225 [Candidatus Nomurabacteria bacterium]|nr:hypothetical protein [Candidatus Nomurabacteria bacterium]